MTYWGQSTVWRYPRFQLARRVFSPELPFGWRRLLQVAAVLLVLAAVAGAGADPAGPNARGFTATAPTEAPRSSPAITFATEPAGEAATSSTSAPPDTITSSWSAPPVTAPLAPAPPVAPAGVELAGRAQALYGVNIVLDGQDWGADEASQLANMGAVVAALQRLPASVRAAVVDHPHGPLTFLSNSQGRTLGGWRPYGDSPMDFYANSDHGAAGAVPANQVVLTPGSSELAIGHEVLHAFQFRDIAPEQYALVMLGDEMRAFAQATGWRQVGTDEQVRQALDQPWSALDALYVYEGRPLTYTTSDGAAGRLRPPNPIEAFAMAGSIYYSRPSWLLLPDWPEYWAWFQQDLG